MRVANTTPITTATPLATTAVVVIVAQAEAMFPAILRASWQEADVFIKIFPF